MTTNDTHDKLINLDLSQQSQILVKIVRVLVKTVPNKCIQTSTKSLCYELFCNIMRPTTQCITVSKPLRQISLNSLIWQKNVSLKNLIKRKSAY